MQQITHAGAWSGIGGFERAADLVGWKNLFQCENNPFCQKVLKYHFPDSELFPDINTADFSKYANKVTVFSSGWPCQPASTAGNRKGTTDVRWGWPQTRRAYQSIQSPVLVFENVAGLFSLLEPESITEVEREAIKLFCEGDTGGTTGRILERTQHRVVGKILEDIKSDGYLLPTYSDGTPIVFNIPAAGVNAPHKRERIWIIAFNPHYWVRQKYGLSAGREMFENQPDGCRDSSNAKNGNDWWSEGGTENGQEQQFGIGFIKRVNSYAQGAELTGNKQHGNPAGIAGSPNGYCWIVSNADQLNDDTGGLRASQVSFQQLAEVFGRTATDTGLQRSEGAGEQAEGIVEHNQRRTHADSPGERPQGRRYAKQRFIPCPDGAYSWTEADGVCSTDVADTTGSGRKESDSRFKPGYTPQDIPDWRSFPTQPPVRSRDAELSMRLAGITVSAHRRESLKALGNAVVVTEVVAIFKAIDEFLNQ